MNILGIDVGGSAFKGAPVDVTSGKLLAPQHLVASTAPCAFSEGRAAVREIAEHFDWRGPIGIGFPGVVVRGRTGAVSLLGKTWERRDLAGLLTRATSCTVRVINDADAAGLAEVRFGAGRRKPGAVLMLTLGTGIGSALFYEGRLTPNLELGEIPWRGKAIELFASARVRTERGLGWREWAERVNVVLELAEKLTSPELIILGGGVSADAAKWFRYLKSRAPVVPAKLRNEAGIVGAALAWQE
ncbi:MAG TPA: ROK family protein [Opitutus sp.]|nr:ROK family protein [Opitutus sp.]